MACNCMDENYKLRPYCIGTCKKSDTIKVFNDKPEINDSVKFDKPSYYVSNELKSNIELIGYNDKIIFKYP